MAQLFAFPPGSSDETGDFGWACSITSEPQIFAELPGAAFGGSFDGATQWLRDHGADARALVAIFARGDGMEAWLAGLRELCPDLPVAGGAAARTVDSHHGETIPHASDLALFAIREGTWQATALTAHRPVGDWITLAGTDPRRFNRTSTGENVDQILAHVRRENGISPGDWDRIALTDRDGVVYHLHAHGDELVSGANLCASREVVPAVFDPAMLGQARMALHEDSIVFGCAGLAGLHECGLPWTDCGAFTALYGEIHPGSGTPRFSNLTLSVLNRIS